MQQDTRGNEYVEATPWLRVTKVATSNGAEIRLNTTDGSRVYRGPQVPQEHVIELIKALLEFV